MYIVFKKYILFLAFCLFCSTLVLGQSAVDLYEEGEKQLFKGRSDVAIEKFNEALEIYAADNLNNTAEAAQCINELGIAHWNEGDNEQALNYLEEALRIRKNISSMEDELLAASYNDIGLVYSTINPVLALKNYNKALSLYEKSPEKNSIKIAQLLINKGIILRQEKEYSEAQENFTTAKTTFISNYGETHPTVAFAIANIAKTYKDREILNIAIDNYEEALEIYKKSYGNKHPEIAQVYDALGQCYLQRGEQKTALEYYQKALIAADEKFKDPSISNNPIVNETTGQVILHTLFLKSQAFEELYFNHSLKIRDLKRSLSTLQSCDTIIDLLRQKKDNKKDKIALGALAEDVYQSAIRISLNLADVSWFKRPPKELAFYFSEKAKSAVLLEAITEAKAKSFANIPNDVLEKEREIKAELTFLEQRVVKSDNQSKTQFESQLLKKQAEYNDFIAEIERDYPEYYKLKYDIKTADVASIQKTLDDSTCVYSYFLATSSNILYVFYINKKTFKVSTVLPESRITHDIKSFRNAILYNSKKTYMREAYNLYRTLFPIKKLEAHTVIIPHGALGLIPFEALLQTAPDENDDYSNLDYLCLNTQISYSYSATLFRDKNNTKASNKNILVYAPIKFESEGVDNSRSGLRDLPGTSTEVKNIKNIFGEQAKIDTLNMATESNLKATSLKDYSIIHFATHGLVNEQNPELSQIFLSHESNDSEEDGSLYSGEIYNLELNADLVVLSACETGIGKVTKGEGIIGLSRALIYCGAENLIVSLWKVADQSTAQLMMCFYEDFYTKNSYSSALSRAKKQLIQEKTYSSPFYWAPFILIGK